MEVGMMLKAPKVTEENYLIQLLIETILPQLILS